MPLIAIFSKRGIDVLIPKLNTLNNLLGTVSTLYLLATRYSFTLKLRVVVWFESTRSLIGPHASARLRLRQTHKDFFYEPWN